MEIPELEESTPKTKSEEIYELLKNMGKKPTPEQIKQIAKGHDVSKALVYKMIRKLKEEGIYQTQKAITPIKAKTPIITIKPEPEIEIKPEPEIPQELIQPEEVFLTPEEEVEQAKAEIPTEIPLIGFKTEDVEWMFKWAFEKLADATDFEGWKLEPEESQKLAEIWTPIINSKSGKLAPYIPYISAVVATAIVILPRVLAYRKFRQKQRAEEEKPKEHEIAEKIPETKPSEQPKRELTQEELEQKKRSQKPPFLKKLT